MSALHMSQKPGGQAWKLDANPTLHTTVSFNVSSGLWRIRA